MNNADCSADFTDKAIPRVNMGRHHSVAGEVRRSRAFFINQTFEAMRHNVTVPVFIEVNVQTRSQLLNRSVPQDREVE